MRGELAVFEEHLFTEQMQGGLRQAIAQVPTAGGAPKVLLSTLPGEQHGLGLLMAEVACALAQQLVYRAQLRGGPDRRVDFDAVDFDAHGLTGRLCLRTN